MYWLSAGDTAVGVFVKEYGGQSLHFSLPLTEFPALYDERLTFPSPLSFLKTTDVYSDIYPQPM